MALLPVLGALVSVIFCYVFATYRAHSRNVAIAKSSGLPVVIVPWNAFSLFWLATHFIWLPLLRWLPAFCKGLWVELLDPEWGHRIGHKPFQDLGCDVFITVGPSNLTAFVADPETITQITSRRNDFPKPLEMYTSLDIYGKNLVSTEGADWRMHRKLTAPSFGEKNNELVFDEALHHAQSLLRLWTGRDGKTCKTIIDPGQDIMRFALYVISSAGFDVRVVWPHEEKETHNTEKANQGSILVGSTPPPGHKMSYREALGELLHNITWTQVLPQKYLRKSPLKIHQTVSTALIEWGKYMEEIYDTKKSEVVKGQNKSGMDLFGALIRGSGIADAKPTHLKKSDLLGNAFVIMLAGHETTANAIHYSLIHLAMRWQSQKRLQDDIDRSIGGKPISKWTYEEDFFKLFNGMAAAVMNETLRILQPIINIPKSTAPGRPQPFTMDGKQYTMPGGTRICLSAATHRNPRYWSDPSCKDQSDRVRDANTFRPERWLVDAKPAESFVDINYDDEELRGPSGEDTSAHLFKPVKGSYIPFSDGFRSCIGRRFAQVEILAVFAVIFSQYSVELAVDDFATDEEIKTMPKGGKEREEVYRKAIDRATEHFQTKMASIITIQLRGVTIPIRFVKRGEERFMFG